MIKFHQHPGGTVVVRDGNAAYTAPIADFLLDAVTVGRPYTPPAEREQFYEPGRVHFISDGFVRMSLGVTWADGDWYIANVAELLAAQHARTAPERQEAARRAARQARIDQLRDKRRQGAPLTPDERLEVLDLFLRV